ncbi:MAG: putative porin [Bacteroidales bacterium]|nr:putative porin [Bacteroidales bacterium]
MHKYFIYIFLLILSTQAFGQQLADTTILDVPVDTTAPIARVWQLKDDYSRLEDYKMDTLQTSFQIYNPVLKYSPFVSHLGNLGLQAQTHMFFQRDPDVPFLFLRPFKPYLLLPENNIYYNVRQPFSLLEYSTTGQNRLKREQMVRAMHTQNVNPYLNFGMDIKLSTSEGHYVNQKGKHSGFKMFGSYIKGDYSVHGSFAYNSFTISENGGLVNDSIFQHTQQDPLTYDVHMTDANSLTRNLGAQITQRYRFGNESEVEDTTSATGIRKLRDRTAKTGSFLHTIEYSRNRRFYEDETPGILPSYYDHFYIDSLSSYDSTFMRSLKNTFQIMLDENPNRKNDFGARAFITHELIKYGHNMPNDTSVSGYSLNQYNNISVGAAVGHTVGGGWTWLFAGRLFLIGYRAGDFRVTGQIDRYINAKKGRSRLGIAGLIRLEEPDYFLQHYASNHFAWENDFKKTKEILASATIENEPLRLKLKGENSTLTDYIYFGTDTIPHQHRGVISIFSVDLYKHFQAGIFNSIHRISYQLPTNNDVIRIPALSYYTSNFIGFVVVKNALTAEIGFDLFFYTKYKGLSFMPSYGMFYHQDEREIGNYPYLDVFINAKLKRTRFFLKFDHLNEGWLDKNYFHVLHYPMPGRAFKFGLSWTFYD